MAALLVYVTPATLYIIFILASLFHPPPLTEKEKSDTKEKYMYQTVCVDFASEAGRVFRGW